MNLSFFRILAILLEGKNTLVFLFLTILGLSFSMGAVLCNLGLMDGYEVLLKKGLQKNSSDFEVSSELGFFDLNKKFRNSLDLEAIKKFTGVIRTEGFIIANQRSKGVLINGVDAQEFREVSELELGFSSQDGVILGVELARELGVGVGDWVVLTFTRGNQNLDDLPYMKRVEVSQLVRHGIYKKDLRIIYMKRDSLAKFANTEKRVNTVLVKLENSGAKQIESVQKTLEKELGFGFIVKPYWSGFKTLIDAVKVEKFSITIILQLIIIIGLFNIVAFINFNAIKKSQEFFLLRALGVSGRAVQRFWVGLILLIWGSSCFCSLLMAFFVDRVVLKLPALKLPGRIYELDYLELSLDWHGVALIFLLTFIWSLGVIFFILWKERKRSILSGLRQQFA